MSKLPKKYAIAALLVVAASLSGCVPSYGFNRSAAGNEGRAEFCESVREFVSATLDENGLRRVCFLPLGTYEDGSIDFYAPMTAIPMDDEASRFYNERAGQLTHYTTAAQFAFEVSKCLAQTQGYRRLQRELTSSRMEASFVDKRRDRQISIRARDRATSILVAGAKWSGDIDAAMTQTCEPRSVDDGARW